MTVAGKYMVAVFVGAVCAAALALVSMAADSRHRLHQEHPSKHLPAGCYFAHEEVHHGQVYQLCDDFRPPPSSSPKPRANAT